ncbi:MFS multidrug transporter [Colletotrichum truncatum]|uniref:MFS multidrug transporter n=1 Tax=Colletotrichum truncatum TaxID=5467 RepID=A0ACC3Z7K8_COLTU|nr:MFS multidrug transporter [Colletotrichum truncatum]KAF6782958.1 MFS multidrug transporter [Colletotrichum truncatum]
MDREPDAHSMDRASTVRRRSIVTMTDRQTLYIDLNLTSTDMFPAVFADDKTSSNTYSQEREVSMNAEPIQPKKDDLVPLEVPPPPKYLSGTKLILVMACVTIVCWLMFLDSSIIVTAIPAITDEFHSLGDIGWYGSAYHLANAAFQPLTGKVYRYFSSKWSFFTFLMIFELGSLICGAAPSSTILIVGRVVAGVGSAGIMSGGLTIIAGSVPLEKRPALTGLLIGLANSGGVFGPVLGGVITQYSTWRWTFYINLPIGGLVLPLLVWTDIPDQVPKPSPMAVIPKLHHYLDFVGFVLCAGAAVLLLLALELGGKEEFSSPTVIGMLCGSAVALVAFLTWNYRKGDDALIPPSMAGKRPVWCAASTNFTMIGSAMIQIYLLPLYFQAVQGVTPSQSGVNVLPSILSQLAAALGGGILVGKLGYYLPWAVGGTAVTIIASGLFTTLTPTTPTAQWVIFQLLTGAGRGVVLQIPSIAVQANLPPEQISYGMSFVTFSQFMGSAVALAIGNAIFVGALKTDLPRFAPNVDPDLVIEAGATGFRKAVAEAALPGVLMAYVSSINKEFYLSLGLALASFCFSWGLGWKDIRPPNKSPKPDSRPS